MFTGIVEEMGRVVHNDESGIRIKADAAMKDIRIGDSIAVDGCCLTVVEHDHDTWLANVSDETRKRTIIETLRTGDAVNLERAARMGDPIGGHFVQGHIDAVGRIVTAGPDLRVQTPEELLPYFVEKGSVAVSGVSLTIVEPLEGGFSVALIPHTMAITTLGSRRPGDLVNIEVDMLAKHVHRLVSLQTAHA